MNSMTGFGAARQRASSGLDVSVEVASLNKRQLDVRVFLPAEFASFELPLKKTAVSRLHRGSVTIRFSVESAATEGSAPLVLDETLAVAYANEADRLRDKLGLSGEVDLKWILDAPGVLSDPVSKAQLELEDFEAPLKKALDALLKTRRSEGDELKKDIQARWNNLSELIDKIKPLTTNLPKLQRARLEKNLAAAGLDVDASDERVLKELVVFSDRCDVSEELTRIRGHLTALQERFSENGPVGKAMEFIVQELQREISTLGVKAANIAISPLVVEFKTELEKIREQVQNVE